MSHAPDPLSHLFTEHHAAVLGFVRSRAPQLADDVVADVFAVAVRRRDAIPAGAERAWLIGVAKNVLRDHLRAERRSAALVEELAPRTPTSVPGPEPVVIGAAFDELPATERAVLALTGLEGLSSAEAADRLGMSAGSARNAMVRARRNLAVQLVGFGLLGLLALVAVVIGRSHGPAAPSSVRELAKRLGAARQVSAVASVEGAGGPADGRYWLRLDRARGRQAFGLRQGVVARGPVGGDLTYRGPSDLPARDVRRTVREAAPAVTAMRTITEGQVQSLVTAAAAGKAAIRTTGAGAGTRTVVRGPVTSSAGTRLELRVQLAGAPAELQRVQVRTAGTAAAWTTVNVDHWRIATGAATAPAETAAPSATPTPRVRASTGSADGSGDRDEHAGARTNPGTVGTGKGRYALTEEQAAINRQVVATTPKYTGPAGPVLRTKMRFVIDGNPGSQVVESYSEIGGDRRGHTIVRSYDAQGRIGSGSEAWTTSSLMVSRTITASGRRLTPWVSLACEQRPIVNPGSVGDSPAGMLDRATFAHVRPGPRRDRHRTVIGDRELDPTGVRLRVWFDAKVPDRPRSFTLRDAERGTFQHTDVLVWEHRPAGAPDDVLEPPLPRDFQLTKMHGCPTPTPSAAATPAPVATATP
ncbi:MAG: RNA polymerase sigma factor [Patulibacter minatonensis]